jgi:hypothetical protein
MGLASPYIAESQFFSDISSLLRIPSHPRGSQIAVTVAPCCHATQLAVGVCMLYSCQGAHMCLFLSERGVEFLYFFSCLPLIRGTTYRKQEKGFVSVCKRVLYFIAWHVLVA